jgi:hypothetical protein
MLFTFLTFAVQTHFSLLGTPFNLSVALVYAFGLKSLSSRTGVSPRETADLKSTLFGAAVGLLEDILAGSIVGPQFFSKGVTGFLTTLTFTDLVFRWTPVVGVITLIILTVLDGAIGMGLRVLFTNMGITGTTAVEAVGIQALIAIPFGIFLRPADFT